MRFAVRIPIVATLALASLPGQVAVAPQQPKWGETIRISYDPSAPGAQLKASDSVWASVRLFFEDNSGKTIAGKMSAVADHRLVYEIAIPDGASLMEISFVTPHDNDSKASATVVISRPDGKPARGANAHLMASHMAAVQRYFDQEIALYPENFTAYRNRWFFSGMSKENDIATIRSDLEKIAAIPQESNEEWLYAMSYAYGRLGDAAKSKDAIQRMVKNFPESPLTSDALSYYIFRATGDVKKEAQRWQRDLVISHPASPHAGFVISGLAEDQEFPFDTVQTVAQVQQQKDPVNVMPYLALASASLAHQRDYPQALAGLQKALDLLFAGEYRIHFDPTGTLTQRRLDEAYRLRGEIHLAQGAFADALADAKAEQSFERTTGTAGHLLEAKIWSALSDPHRADAALREASHRDSGADPKQPKRAFSFDAVALDGKHWSLPELKGKTVALNFWFVGCLPCRQEIPILNQLVDRYKDVVFLAFALDGEEQLHDFLAKYPFHYQVIPNAQKIADGFAVPAYPTHVLINPAGEIVLDSTDDVEALRAKLAGMAK